MKNLIRGDQRKDEETENRNFVLGGSNLGSGSDSLETPPAEDDPDLSLGVASGLVSDSEQQVHEEHC